jgi:hypothetical protein
MLTYFPLNDLGWMITWPTSMMYQLVFLEKFLSEHRKHRKSCLPIPNRALMPHEVVVWLDQRRGGTRSQQQGASRPTSQSMKIICFANLGWRSVVILSPTLARGKSHFGFML